MNDGAFIQGGREDVWTLCLPCWASSTYLFVRRGNLGSHSGLLLHTVFGSLKAASEMHFELSLPFNK